MQWNSLGGLAYCKTYTITGQHRRVQTNMHALSGV